MSDMMESINHISHLNFSPTKYPAVKRSFMMFAYESMLTLTFPVSLFNFKCQFRDWNKPGPQHHTTHNCSCFIIQVIICKIYLKIHAYYQSYFHLLLHHSKVTISFTTISASMLALSWTPTKLSPSPYLASSNS